MVALFKDLFHRIWRHQSLLGDSNEEESIGRKLKAILGSFAISPGLAVGLHKSNEWEEDFSGSNPLDYSTMKPVCDGLTFGECSLKRSPALKGLFSGLDFTLPKIKDYSCDPDACEVS